MLKWLYTWTDEINMAAIHVIYEDQITRLMVATAKDKQPDS